MTTELESLKKRVEELENAAKPPEPFVREPMQRFDPTEGASMPPSALREMLKVTPEGLMRDLRADARRPNPTTEASSSTVTSTPAALPQPQRRGTGWAPERGFPDRTKEFELVDRIVKKMVGGPNDPVK